jgi:hypothetical protein
MTIDREQQARAREVLDALPFERFPDRGVRWYSRKTVLEALQAFADEARLTERAETGWQPIDTAPEFDPIVITDGQHVAKAAREPTDFDGHYWVTPDGFVPDWEPTHWIADLATAIRTPNEEEVS